MSIHFAAAQNAEHSPVARVLRYGAVPFACNDNGPIPARDAPSNEILRAALRHFAAHGLSAARVARTKAQEAFFADDRAAYDWWMAITRTLDRRLAAQAMQGEAVILELNPNSN